MQSEAVNQWLDAAHVRSLAEGLLVPGPQGSGVTTEKMFGASFVGFAGPGPAEAIAPATEIARQSLSDAQSRAAASGIIQGEDEPVFVSRSSVEVEPAEVIPEPAPVEVEALARMSPEPIQEVEAAAVQTRPEPVPPVNTPVIDSPFKIAGEKKETVEPVAKSFRPLPLSTRLQAFGIWLMEQIPTRSYFICDRHGEIVVDEVGSDKLVKVARTLAHASSSAGRQVGDDDNLGSLHVKIGPDRVMEVIPRHSHFGLVVLGVIVQRPLSQDAVASVSRALGTALAEPSAPRE